MKTLQDQLLEREAQKLEKIKEQTENRVLAGICLLCIFLFLTAP